MEGILLFFVPGFAEVITSGCHLLIRRQTDRQTDRHTGGWTYCRVRVR